MKKITLIIVVVAVIFCASASEKDDITITERNRIEKELEDMISLDAFLQTNDEVKKHGLNNVDFERVSIENALRLAIKHPGSDLSHAVYSNIIDDELLYKKVSIIDKKFKECKDAIKKEKLHAQFLEEFHIYCEGKTKRWISDLKPMIKKYLLIGKNNEIYIPECVKEDPHNGSDLFVVDEKEDDKFLNFQGITLGEAIDNCGAIIQQDFSDRGYARCRLPYKVANCGYCDVYYTNKRIVSCVSIFQILSSIEDYENLITEFANLIYSDYGHYKNKTFLVGKEKKDGINSAIMCINIFRKNHWYVLRIEQGHAILSNELAHYVKLDVLFGGEVPNWGTDEKM